MKHLTISLFTLYLSLLTIYSAVPLRWTVETSAANPATFDQFAGATYDLEAALQSRGKPLAVDGEPHLYWQTNGMGSAWWTAPATASGNVLRATWTPSCDVGARVYSCFIGITGTVYNAAFQLRLRPSPGAVPNVLPLPTPVIDFARVTVLNPPYYSRAETDGRIEDARKSVIGDATNAAIRATTPLFRPFGDEYVYEPAGYTDFTWHGDRQDAIEAIGNRQPEIAYDYGDNYVEWTVDFYMGGQYYHGYSYSDKTSPSVPFDFFVDYYDPVTGEWIYDYFTLTAVRTISGWKRADPIDTFAHQGALTKAMRSFMAMSNTLYTGESKVMRTGEPNQYGSGWGYYRRPLGSDFRSWRIRIPRSNVSGMSGSASAHVNPFYDFSGNRHDHYNLANPLCSLPDYWKIGRKLVHTDGAYGQESVEQFDMDVGLVRRSAESEDAGYYVNFRVKCISADPRVFETTPLLSSAWHEMSEWTNGTTRTMMCRPVDLPHVTGPKAYYESNYGYCHVDMSSIYVDPTTVVSTNSAVLTFFIRDATDKRTNNQNPSYSYATTYYEVSNVVRRVDVTLNYTAESQLEDFIIQSGRVLTDDVSNLYYDPAADCTYRISVSNGCFYSEWHAAGDWRKNGL